MSAIDRVAAATDPRLAREPDGRGGRLLGRGRWSRRRSVRRLHGRARGGRAARRRSAGYLGKGVLRAVGNVAAALGPAVKGIDAGDQAAVDATLIELDGSPSKSALGANALLGVSLAVAKAAATDAGVSLYRSLGGEEAVLPGADDERRQRRRHAANTLDLQEFMVVPAGAGSFAEALQVGAEVYHTLKGLLHERGLPPPWATKAASLRISARARRRSTSFSPPPAAGHRSGSRSRSTRRHGDLARGA